MWKDKNNNLITIGDLVIATYGWGYGSDAEYYICRITRQYKMPSLYGADWSAPWISSSSIGPEAPKNGWCESCCLVKVPENLTTTDQILMFAALSGYKIKGK